MSMWRWAGLLGICALFWGTPVRADAPRVVVSIKPLHSLVSGVMQGIGAPDLIVTGSASPHGHSLKPSQARALENAELVFWIGHELERFLEKPIKTLGAGATAVAMMDVPGVIKRKTKDGKDDKHNHDHDHGGVNPHIWLDPENAKAMVRVVVLALSKADPARAGAYAANEKKVLAGVDDLLAEMKTLLAPVRSRPFIVFHDAYSHLSARFGLNPQGVLSMNPAILPGARRVGKMRETIVETGVVCLFAEPQFNDRVVQLVVNGTPARAGILDPLGAGLEPGPALYFDLMRANAKALRECLGRGK